MVSPSIQETQEDWPTLSLSLPPSSPPPSPSPSPPHPPPFQYISLPPLQPPSPSSLPLQLFPSPASPHPSPIQYIPLPPLPLQPPQLMYPPLNQEPYFSAPPQYPPYTPSQEPHNLVTKDEFPKQESSSGEEVRASRKTRVSRRSRASSSNPPRAVRPRREVNGETVPPPFPWATSKRAIIYSLDHLRSQGVTAITGAVKCKHCEEQRDIAFNLEEKFNEVAQFIEENKFDLHDRAPESWNHPVLPTCERCGTENSLKPVITKKRSINWLFLFLGQMIGCCKLEQLKYFCKHAMNHRTGAKDRLLYSVYLGLCKQLHPEGPYA